MPLTYKYMTAHWQTSMPLTNKYMTSHFPGFNGAGTSMKSDGGQLVLWAQTSALSEVMRSCKCFPHVSKMPTLTYNRQTS